MKNRDITPSQFWKLESSRSSLGQVRVRLSFQDGALNAYPLEERVVSFCGRRAEERAHPLPGPFASNINTFTRADPHDRTPPCSPTSAALKIKCVLEFGRKRYSDHSSK